MGVGAYVVEHTSDLLAIYVPERSPFAFAAGGDWPTSNGRHPWDGVSTHWQGPGCLQLQRPGEAYAVWRLAHDDGSVATWYVNLQAPFVAHGGCVDTLDHELDVVVTADGRSWTIKDADMVDVSTRLGRFDADQADRIRRQADDVLTLLTAGDRWWDPWQTWHPDPAWTAPKALPTSWIC
jgi:hypothetical protein